MPKVLRIAIIVVFAILAFYVMITLFFVFLVLVLIGVLYFVFLKYFAKKPLNKDTAEGVVIEHEQVVNEPSKNNIIAPVTLGKNKVKGRAINEPIPGAYEPTLDRAMYCLHKSAVENYQHSPNEHGPQLIEGLIKFTGTDFTDNKLKAKSFRLLGEMHETGSDWEKAIECYTTALSIDRKVGVKRKLAQLHKKI